MFTIDLLQGQGRPVRTKPQGVAIFVATFTVPALVAILMGGYYVRNQVVISILKQNIAGFNAQTQRLGEDIKLKESGEREKLAVSSCLADVTASIHRHTQWSTVLVALVENLPDSVVLTSIEVKQKWEKRKTAAAKDDTSVPVRTLKMRVSGNPSYDCDREVKKFRDRLRASEVLGPRLEDIVIASQGQDKLDDLDVVAYDIECVFKPGL
jgi:Tfp pilus assembly protein PilN